MSPLMELLPVYGPWLLFVLAVLETCFITGLFVPSGVATSVGTILAVDGALDLGPVIVAAMSGGALGDALGFWIGRLAGERVLAGRGRISRLAARQHGTLGDFFGRHPVYSVTTARLISFVRTLMPMAAGMSGISFSRYVPFEVAGLVGWAAIYVTIGLVAGESWELATRLVGVGGAVAFVLVGIALWTTLRRRLRAGPRADAR